MLAPWKKGYNQPRQHIKKQRHYLLTKICLVKAMGFPVVMYRCESWTIKKAEHWRIDAFELWCSTFLRVPWTARRSSQSFLKEISPEYSWEGLMLNWNSSTSATWCEELTHSKRPWCWERLKQEEKGMTEDEIVVESPTRWAWVWASSKRWWWTRKPGTLQSMGSQRVGHDWVTEQPSAFPVAKSCTVLCNPWTVARQTPLLMGFLRKEYWSGLTFSFPGNLLHQGWTPCLLHQQVLYCWVTQEAFILLSVLLLLEILFQKFILFETLSKKEAYNFKTIFT